MNNQKICDNCLYYYGYGLMDGVCMIFFTTSESPLDKHVTYTDSCDDWVVNDDPKKRKLERDTYLAEKKRYAELKRRSKEKAGLS